MSVRFAPSPTGRFHVGNLRTAWVSHAWARALNVPWAVRFEDIDAPRNIPGALESQLADLMELGLVPDVVSRQSERRARHYELFQRAIREGLLYLCYCSRREVQIALGEMASAPHKPAPVYDGKCRARTAAPSTKNQSVAWRFRDPDPSGRMDFIAARTDLDGGSYTPAYHWACAVDDIEEKHLLIVRAWDLEAALLPQRQIQAWMGSPPPACFHTALVIGNDGARLEKRMRGIFIDELDISSVQLKARFAASLDLEPATFGLGKIWGETKHEITLRELNL